VKGAIAQGDVLRFPGGPDSPTLLRWTGMLHALVASQTCNGELRAC